MEIKVDATALVGVEKESVHTTMYDYTIPK
jgi:hypothetical protein